MTEETTFYSDNQGVRVTNTRLIVDQTTYAMANIASVSTTTTKPSYTGPLLLIAAGAIIFFTTIGGRSPESAIVGVIVVALGVLWWRSKKPIYHLRITSASGESNALWSKNRNYVDKVVQAINEAMIHRG